jgi:hypothetical protein
MSGPDLRSAIAEEQANLAKRQAAIAALCAKLGIGPDEDIVSWADTRPSPRTASNSFPPSGSLSNI